MSAGTPALVDEAEIARKLQLVCVFRRAVFPIGILDNNSELAFRASAQVTKLAYGLHLRDFVRKLAEEGNPEAQEFRRTLPR